MDRKVRPLVKHIERKAARQKLVQLAQAQPPYAARLTITGENGGRDFAICVTPDGLCYGERDFDGACDLEAYGPDGELLLGWGGDGLNLLEEVSR